MSLAHAGRTFPLVGLGLIVVSIAISLPSSAQSKCSSTLECAQQAVDAAAKAGAAVQMLESRIAKLEALQATFGNGRILAMIQVKNGQIQPTSSPNVSFDQGSGIVSFPNPRNLVFLPVVSDANDAPYITQTHWIRAILPPDKFIVRAKAMDTGDRTWPPHDFTATVVGFEAPPNPDGPGGGRVLAR